MSAHDDGKARQESQAVLDAIDKYEQIKLQIAMAKTAGDVNQYRNLKRESLFARRELARLTNEQ